ncbi:hypothetical protein FrEUN1fDRAFT_4008 [Parafrankia sp. EUN1f]|nr:hypothetical protein FrEUN1fDRAFT_4008 [Parafrankia sp. EUN1f]
MRLDAAVVKAYSQMSRPAAAMGRGAVLAEEDLPA